MPKTMTNNHFLAFLVIIQFVITEVFNIPQRVIFLKAVPVITKYYFFLITYIESFFMASNFYYMNHFFTHKCVYDSVYY